MTVDFKLLSDYFRAQFHAESCKLKSDTTGVGSGTHGGSDKKGIFYNQVRRNSGSRCDCKWSQRRKLTIFIHGCVEAFPQSARSALVPMSLVNGTLAVQVALRFTSVHPVPMDAPLEESRTSCRLH